MMMLFSVHIPGGNRDGHSYSARLHPAAFRAMIGLDEPRYFDGEIAIATTEIIPLLRRSEDRGLKMVQRETADDEIPVAEYAPMQSRLSPEEVKARRRDVEDMHREIYDVFRVRRDLHSWLWPLIYLECVVLPRPLSAALSTVNLLTEDAPLLEYVEDLLVEGVHSATYGNIRELWGAMVEADNAESLKWPEAMEEYREAASDLLYYWVDNTPSSVTNPEQMGAAVDFLQMNRSLSPMMYPLYYSLEKHRGHPAYGIAYAAIEALEEESSRESAPLRSSPLAWFVSNLEFITPETFERFLDMVEEYNWEWALAAFDWSNGEQPTLLPRLQGLVDSSPWPDSL